MSSKAVGVDLHLRRVNILVVVVLVVVVIIIIIICSDCELDGAADERKLHSSVRGRGTGVICRPTASQSSPSAQRARRSSCRSRRQRRRRQRRRYRSGLLGVGTPAAGRRRPAGTVFAGEPAPPRGASGVPAASCADAAAEDAGRTRRQQDRSVLEDCLPRPVRRLQRRILGLLRRRKENMISWSAP